MHPAPRELHASTCALLPLHRVRGWVGMDGGSGGFGGAWGHCVVPQPRDTEERGPPRGEALQGARLCPARPLSPHTLTTTRPNVERGQTPALSFAFGRRLLASAPREPPVAARGAPSQGRLPPVHGTATVPKGTGGDTEPTPAWRDPTWPSPSSADLPQCQQCPSKLPTGHKPNGDEERLDSGAPGTAAPTRDTKSLSPGISTPAGSQKGWHSHTPHQHPHRDMPPANPPSPARRRCPPGPSPPGHPGHCHGSQRGPLSLPQPRRAPVCFTRRRL